MITHYSNNFNGKLCFITGGSKGIGKEICSILLNCGWNIIAPSHYECDLLSYDSVRRYAHILQSSIESLDAVILNAHEWYSKPISKQAIEDFEKQMRYTFSHWLILQKCITNIYRANGCVVGISSMRGLIGGVDSAPYSMAKAAMIAMIQGFSRECPGIRFNVVCPGWTMTDMGRKVLETGGVSNPNITPQLPADVARTTVRLLNDPCADGEVWKVNCGVEEKIAWQAY